MGLELLVTPTRPLDHWPALQQRLADRDCSCVLGMIDQELALPEEEPPPHWMELRLRTPQGMVTIRREPDLYRVIVWGNADEALRHVWQLVAWAVADCTQGTIQTEHGPVSAAVFQSRWNQ